MNYENYIFDVIDVADYITEASLEYTEKNNISDLVSIYETTDQVNQYIRSITLITNDGSRVASSESYKLLGNNLEFKNWFTSAKSDSSIYHFSSPHIEDIYPAGNHIVITVSKEIHYYEDGIETSGVLAIELEVSNFQALSEKTNLGESGHIIIVDENNEPVFTSNTDCFDGDCESISIIEEIILGGKFVNVSEKNMYVNVNTISLTRWKIATFVNAESVSTAKNKVILSLTIAFFVAFTVTFFVSSMFSRRITSPIYELNKYMKRFQKGKSDEKIEIKGQKELVELGESFNEMIKEISSLMNEVMIEQRAKRKTQFIALQNQINPHFLYNTLDSILWLNENNLNSEVEKMIVALSRFFRISISTENNVIPLSEEIEHVQNYLLIQKIRYNNRFVFSFEVDESLLEFHVLKLGLQPIVENAIYHGISPDAGHNVIVIRAYRENDNVVLEVENNGFGITEEEIQDLYSTFEDTHTSKHIGLKNISQRLSLYYGDKGELKIISKLDEYTKVQLRYPLNEGDVL
jgi:two-component system sensor histidine kinase YesM